MAQFQFVQHKGACYGIKSIGPVVAKEFAPVEAVDMLFKGKDNKLLSDNEAIF